MGKNTRRALLGFAAGALKGVSEHFRTKQMLEAEALKEQRLAAIRAGDRQATQSFQREIMGEQFANQTARDEAQAAQRKEEIAAQGDQRMREIDASGRNQLQVAGAYAANRGGGNGGGADGVSPGAKYIVNRGGSPAEVLGSDLGPDDEIIGAVSASGSVTSFPQRAPRPAGTGTVLKPSAPGATPAAMSAAQKAMLPDYIFVNGKSVPNPAKQ